MASALSPRCGRVPLPMPLHSGLGHCLQLPRFYALHGRLLPPAQEFRILTRLGFPRARKCSPVTVRSPTTTESPRFLCVRASSHGLHSSVLHGYVLLLSFTEAVASSLNQRTRRSRRKEEKACNSTAGNTLLFLSCRLTKTAVAAPHIS